MEAVPRFNLAGSPPACSSHREWGRQTPKGGPTFPATMPAKPATSATGFVCPRDGTAITSRLLGGPALNFYLHECPKCKGTWFDRGELRKLMHDNQVEALLRDYAAPGENPISCPRDGEPMERRKIQDVEVDACEACGGFWLDRDELEPLEEGVHELEEEERPLHPYADLDPYDVSLLTLVAPHVLARPKGP